MQIAAACVASATNKAQAIRELLDLKNPEAILAASGNQERMEAR